MKSILNHPAPNIVPGVNLTADRFTAIYAWITAQMSDVIQSTRPPFHFGLVIPDDAQPSLQLDKIGPQLVLTRCIGITPAGQLIGHFNELHQPLTLEIEEKQLRGNEKYQVLVEISQNIRHGFGPESTDFPMRPLFSRVDHKLHVQLATQSMAETPNVLPIGTMEMEYGEWKLSKYIPPCAQIGANPMLRERQRIYQEELRNMLHLFPQIIVNTDAYHEKSMVELREFTIFLGAYLSSAQCRYSHIGECGNPFLLFELWSTVARQASFLLQCLKDRPGFYNLLNENTRQRSGVYFTPQSWDMAIQDMANLMYNHYDILLAVKITDHFLEAIVPVFKALAYGVEEVKNRTGWSEQKKTDYRTW